MRQQKFAGKNFVPLNRLPFKISPYNNYNNFVTKHTDKSLLV